MNTTFTPVCFPSPSHMFICLCFIYLRWLSEQSQGFWSVLFSNLHISLPVLKLNTLQTVMVLSCFVYQNRRFADMDKLYRCCNSKTVSFGFAFEDFSVTERIRFVVNIRSIFVAVFNQEEVTQSPDPVIVLAASPSIFWPETNEGRALQLCGLWLLQHCSALFLWRKQEEEVR